MKKIFILSSILVFALFACDKQDNAYPAYSGGLDPALYPGNINDYVVPSFNTSTNTDRNVLLEDFTGHQCTFCPQAADVAHGLETSNPGRVFVSTIHSGPDGMSGFQATSPPDYIYDFTNPVSLEIGQFFGNLPGNSFSANPSGNVSRIPGTVGSISTGQTEWPGKTNSLLTANDLKVNIESVVNYFGSTNGAFIHIGVEKLVTISNDLRIVVAFYEDSIVKPQTKFGAGTVLDYVHRDLLKSHVNGDMSGQLVSDNNLLVNGIYQFDYSFQLPSNVDVNNSHLLIYVFDKVTQEVYQVIKKKLI